MKTILLDTLAWDLVLDVRGNIALASEPYALAQDVASAIKLRYGELLYDVAKGVRYETILGASPSLTYFKAQMIAAAKTVPGVVSARCFLSSTANREIKGQVQFTDSEGNKLVASF